jgi:hypothetical protein
VRAYASEQVAYGYRSDSEKTDNQKNVDRQRAVRTVGGIRLLAKAITATAFEEETKRNLIGLAERDGSIETLRTMSLKQRMHLEQTLRDEQLPF